jgi:hypothetical protein
MIAYRCDVLAVCVLVSLCACSLTLTGKDVEIGKFESQCVVCHPNIKMLIRLGWEIYCHSCHNYLAYWKVQDGVLPGIGKMFGYAYTHHDNTFEANWEIVEEY